MSNFGAPQWKRKIKRGSRQYMQMKLDFNLQMILVWQIEKQSLKTDSNIFVWQLLLRSAPSLTFF